MSRLSPDEILTLRAYALRAMDHGPMRSLLLRATDQMAVSSDGVTPEQAIELFGEWDVKLVPWQLVRLRKKARELANGVEG